MSSHSADDNTPDHAQDVKQQGYNKVLLLGWVDRPPEFRRTSRGIATGSFPLAVPEATSGTGQAEMDEGLLVEVVLFGELAEQYCGLLKAGSSVFLEGALSRRRWQTAGGVMKSRLEVVVQNMRVV